jgi:hypothetical protein
MIARQPLLREVPPEFELLCLTGRVEFAASAAERAAAIVADGRLDWSGFLSRVERNCVGPLAHRNLRSLREGSVSAKVLDTLRVRSKITAFKSEQFATELARLVTLFDSSGIRTIHYKGAVTAHEFYGSASLRNFNDLDFLVRPGDVRATIRLLEAQGYENSEQLTQQQITFYVREFKEFLFRRGEISLEPHWSLAGRRYPFDPDYDGFWSRSRILSLRGAQMRVMSLEDSLLVLCLAGAKGRWKRLQMVTDLAACMSHFAEADWQRVQDRAAVTRTVRILNIGLLLARELSGATLPPDVEARVLLDSSAWKLAREATLTLMNGEKKSHWLPNTPAIFSRLLFQQRESARDRLTYLWHTMTTPHLLHLQRMPLPRTAYLLYRVLVPLHDFVLYPLAQLAKAVPRLACAWRR